MCALSSLAYVAAWRSRQDCELGEMRRRARERLAQLDADVLEWRSLRELSGPRLVAARDAIDADIDDAKAWWRGQLAERGFDQQLIETLVKEYEAAFRVGLRERVSGY